MSYWMEIHCDIRSDVPDPSRPLDDRTCHTNSNTNPSAMGSTSAKTVRAAVSDALARGWVNRDRNQQPRGWVCPHCQRFALPRRA